MSDQVTSSADDCHWKVTPKPVVAFCNERFEDPFEVTPDTDAIVFPGAGVPAHG